MKVEVDKIDKEILVIFRPEIDRFRKLIQSFLCEQKTQNFRLLKEIKQLETDKYEIQDLINVHLERLIKIEKSIGIKPSLYANQFDKTVTDKDGFF